MPATTNATKIAYLKETAFGTVAATQPKTLRLIGESLDTQRGATISQEIATRRIRDSIRTSLMGSGSLNTELSYGNLDDFLEAGLWGAWTTNVLKDGVNPISLTVEKQFADTASAVYYSFTGMRVATLGLSISPGRPIAAEIGLMGKKGVASGATIFAGGAPSAAGTNPVMNPVDHVVLLQEGGSTLSNVSEITLSVNNSLRALAVLGSPDPLDINPGQFVVTGTVTVFFTSTTLLAKFLAETQSSLAFTLGGASNLKYLFEVAALKYVGAPVVAQGPNGDVFCRLAFQSIEDATKGNLQITRTP